jgi:hypothetical protein
MGDGNDDRMTPCSDCIDAWHSAWPRRVDDDGSLITGHVECFTALLAGRSKITLVEPDGEIGDEEAAKLFCAKCALGTPVEGEPYCQDCIHELTDLA